MAGEPGDVAADVEGDEERLRGIAERGASDVGGGLEESAAGSDGDEGAVAGGERREVFEAGDVVVGEGEKSLRGWRERGEGWEDVES